MLVVERAIQRNSQIIAADHTIQVSHHIRIGGAVIGFMLSHCINQIDHLGGDIGGGGDAARRQGIVTRIRTRQRTADSDGFAGARVLVVKRAANRQLQIVAAEYATQVCSYIRIERAVVDFVLRHGIDQVDHFLSNREGTAGSGEIHVVAGRGQINGLPCHGIVTRIRACGRACRCKRGRTDVAGVVLGEHIAVSCCVHKPAQRVIGAGNRRDDGVQITVGLAAVNRAGDRQRGLHGKHIAVARRCDRWRATPAGIPDRLIAAGQTTKGVVIRVIAVDQPAAIGMGSGQRTAARLIVKGCTGQHQRIAGRAGGHCTAAVQDDASIRLRQQCVIAQFNAVLQTNTRTAFKRQGFTCQTACHPDATLCVYAQVCGLDSAIIGQQVIAIRNRIASHSGSGQSSNKAIPSHLTHGIGFADCTRIESANQAANSIVPVNACEGGGLADRTIAHIADQATEIDVSLHFTGGIGLANAGVTSHMTDQTTNIIPPRHHSGGIGLADTATTAQNTDQTAYVKIIPGHRAGSIGLANTAAGPCTNQTTDVIVARNVDVSQTYLTQRSTIGIAKQSDIVCGSPINK